ncbi:winged helix-turn-helix transcriptional regulator [Alicyclobacillus mengziensis]|uniref:Winged helix-turn-helix transcriptional regulator n=2 Tax=Alicyclobacillus mengziensis TaxID=2931921 RepID=A0A9X7VZA6_9BACL|nr:winged helix-turn-helix transcriptional regulator [Alicyclobacillus mengziensis]
MLSMRFISEFEFTTALYQVANVELFLSSRGVELVNQDRRVTRLLSMMRSKLTPFLERELRFFFEISDPSSNQAFHERAIEFQTFGDVSAFADYLQNLDPVLIVDSINEDNPQNQASNRVKEAQLDFPETQLRFRYVVGEFLHRCYLPVEDALREMSRESVEAMTTQFWSEQEMFYAQFLKMESTSFKPDVVVHMSPLTEVGCQVWLTPSGSQCDYVRIGTRTPELIVHQDDRKVVDSFRKVLSDKQRMTIMELLAGRPWYGQELAQQLGISAASISHHMSLLLDLNLVHIERSEHRVYYKLQQHRLVELFEMLQRSLLEGAWR